MHTKQLYLIGNAHIDPVWLWQWREGFQEVKASFRSALDRLAEYDDFVFTASSAVYYEWVEQNDPQMFAEIKQRVAEGRWDIVGGWWIEPDCNLPGGESFVRQALYGQRYFFEKFGKTATVGYNVDSFGHHGMLPQLLQLSGLDTYVFMRPAPHEKGLPGRLFWWESDDGSRVLTYRLPHPYATQGRDLEQHIARCLDELDSAPASLMCFYGVGNHGGGPTKANIELIQRLQGAENSRRLTFAGPSQFFAELPLDVLQLPTVHDDLQHHASGCYAAHSAVKRLNRWAEHQLLIAEKFAALASWVTGQPYPASELARGWKNVLFNQFHDILAGTSLEEAYDDAAYTYGEALAIADRSANNGIQSLAWQIRIDPEPDMKPIVVFNPHAWPVNANVELECRDLAETDILVTDEDEIEPIQLVQSHGTARRCRRFTFQAKLPPLGYRTYRLRPGSGDVSPPIPVMRAGAGILENERLRLEIDQATGGIARLYDKQAGVDVFADTAAVGVVIDDPSDTWSHDVFVFNKVSGVFAGTSVRLMEHGPVKSVIRSISTYGQSRLIQDFTLCQELEEVQVQVTVDWHEAFKMLKLRFPVNLDELRLTSEIPFGHIERPANEEEEPGQSWVDVSGVARPSGLPYGCSFINNGKYSYSAAGRELYLTVLRSPIYAHHVPVEPDPTLDYVFMDQGRQRFSYTILPHRQGWRAAATVRRAWEMNQPPVALIETYHPWGTLPQQHSFIEVDAANIVVSALKRAEDSDDLILRCYETHREPAHAVIRLPHWQREIEVAFRPCEIKTLRVPLDAAAPVVETNLLEW